MKKMALTFILISAMIISAIPISAEEGSAPRIESIQSGGTEVTIKGDFNVAAGNSEVAVYVYKKDKTTTDLKVGEDGISALIYQGQTTTDADGKFEFVFVMPEDVISGYYNAYIGGGNPFAIIEHHLYYRSEADIANASTGFVEAADAEDYTAFKNTFNLYSEVLAVGQTIPDVEIDKDSVCEILYDYYVANTIDKKDTDKCIEIIQYCTVLSAIYDEKVTDLFDYSSLFGIDESRLKSFLSAPYVTEKFKKNVTTNVASAKVKNPAEVIYEIYEEFVLEAVREPISYTNLKPLLKEFITELGIKESDITNSACIKIADESYNDWDELGKAITNKADNSGKGSGNKGGSGGGSAGGLAGSVVPVEKSEVSIPEKLPVTIFDDLDSVVWAEDAIVYLAENAVLNGKGDNKFCPNDRITREEFAKILTLVFFADGEAAEISFADVPADAWYHKPVAVAYGAGIVKGISDTMFGTGESITRQDAAVMACRAAEAAKLWTEAEIDNSELFFDDSEIDKYAKEAVYTLYSKKVVNGTGNGEFSPKAQMTRAEAAKMIYELLNV